MNSVKFNQSGGFPWDTNIFDFAQNAWTIFNALGSVVGNLAIIQGCDVVGNTALNGVVYINGELLEFRGGNITANVIIVESAAQLEFEDSTTKDIQITRYATFGTATTQYAWANFKKSMTLLEVTAAVAIILTKLNTIEYGAQVNVKPDWNAIAGNAAEILNKPNIPNTLYTGKAVIGSMPSNSTLTVNFPNIGTNNYSVIGTIKSLNTNGNREQDLVSFATADHQNTSFEFMIYAHINTGVRNIEFHYMIISN